MESATTVQPGGHPPFALTFGGQLLPLVSVPEQDAEEASGRATERRSQMRGIREEREGSWGGVLAALVTNWGRVPKDAAYCSVGVPGTALRYANISRKIMVAAANRCAHAR